MEKETRNILIAAGSGLVVGAALGILFAPAKGSETRAAISGKVSELKNSVQNGDLNPAELIAKMKDKLESGLSNGKTAVKDELLEQIQKLENSLS